MKIKLLTSMACSVNGTHKHGEVVDWKDVAEAKRLIAAGEAEAVGSPKKTKTEKATSNKAAETAALD